MRLAYPVKEMFLTVQGEGCYAGARAVFLRFAGCNVWSGRERDRAKDVQNGCCAAWCDTDFRGTNGQLGGSHSARKIVQLVRQLWGRDDQPLVICTGGEPSLVLDEGLVESLRDDGARVHVETNGSNPLPDVDWVTLSPKPPMNVVDQRYDEVKVVVPAIDPLPFEHRATHRFVQPLDDREPAKNARNVQHALAFVMANPGWRLGVQMHKIVGVP